MNELNSDDKKPETPVMPELADDQGKLGEIQIALPVVENMVRMISLEAEGVVDVIGAGAGSITGIFSSKSDNRSGVKVIEDEAGAYAIEVRVSLEFGVELATVAYNIQNLVIDKIAKMTSKGVTKVDVYIDRVEKPGVTKVESEVVEQPSPIKKKSTRKTAKKTQEPEVEPKAE